MTIHKTDIIALATKAVGVTAALASQQDAIKAFLGKNADTALLVIGGIGMFASTLVRVLNAPAHGIHLTTNSDGSVTIDTPTATATTAPTAPTTGTTGTGTLTTATPEA